ncbi:hypothetical protein [Paenibacillus ottowii]|uniref:hypothetical protein n=1 Tax=Paenibacillus ottowii TaxID=2315729 RepID=UPI003D2EA31F
MATVVLAGCGTEGEAQNPITTTPETAQTTVDTPDVKAASETDSNTYIFDMTVGDFTEAFNAVAQKYKLDYLHISKLKIEHKKFQYTFNDELSMIGTIDSKQKIQEVMLIGSGGFKKRVDGNLMTAMIALIMTTNSDYNYDNAQDLLKEMGVLDKNENENVIVSTTIKNRVKYKFKIKNNDMTTFRIIGTK